MKILYHHRIASKDGQNVHVEEIIHALRELGHEVRVVAPGLHDDSEFGHEGGWVARLKAALPKALYELLEMGYSLHAGQVIVADGTPAADARLQRVLTADPAMGLFRHWDAGYETARQTAVERGAVRHGVPY